MIPEQELRALLKARVEERRRWAEFQRIYERCVAIAEATWSARLDAAQLAQQTLAEAMRDRGSRTFINAAEETETVPGNEIPTPLFTPRDRVEFLARATHALMMGAEKRNLGALPELKEAPPEQPPVEAPEAASGADELSGVEVAPV